MFCHMFIKITLDDTPITTTRVCARISPFVSMFSEVVVQTRLIFEPFRTFRPIADILSLAIILVNIMVSSQVFSRHCNECTSRPIATYVSHFR